MDEEEHITAWRSWITLYGLFRRRIASERVIGIDIERLKGSVCGDKDGEGREEDSKFEYCALVRGGDDVLGEMDLLLPSGLDLSLLLLLLLFG